MGKLNIAHHKSYHPYRRDNIERVRRDEEEARLKEAQEEGRLALADSEARIALLREKAGIESGPGKKKGKPDDDMKQLAAVMNNTPTPSTSGGHINFFEDLEENAIASAIKASKAKVDNTDKGVALAPSAKDLNPWYSERRDKEKARDEKEEERMLRDSLRKSQHDPLTSITRELAAVPSASSTSYSRPSYRAKLPAASSAESTQVNERLARESSERERALALIRRRKREMQGSETPSTVRDDASEYGDMYNRRDVEAAHRYKAKRWDDNPSGRYARDGWRDRGRDNRSWG